MKENEGQNVQVRYIVNDVDTAIAFYTGHLDFKLVMHPAPAFAMLLTGKEMHNGFRSCFFPVLVLPDCAPQP